jgi:hypothetical protein
MEKLIDNPINQYPGYNKENQPFGLVKHNLSLKCQI